MIKDFIKLSLSSISQRRIRSWLTMIGIFIGIAAVVSLISLGQGLKEAITGQFNSLGTDKLVIQASGTNRGPPGSTVVKRLSEDDLKAIKKVTGVSEAAGRFIRTSRVFFNDVPAFKYMTSIPQDDSRKLVLEVLEQSFGAELYQGRMLTKQDKYKIVVGNAFATKEIFERKLRLGDSLIISGKSFEIIGILERTGSLFGEEMIIMNEEPMKEVLKIGNEVDLIAVKVDNVKDIALVADRIERVMRKQRDVEKGQEDFSVETPMQAVQSLNDILNYATWFLVFIAMISLVVGGVGIMNTMYTAVLERTKEIGIMKAIGARNSNIMLLFILESGMLGMLGGIIGIILGIGLAKSVEFIAYVALGTMLIKTQFNIYILLGPLLFSFFVGTLSGVLPALQAAKMKPVDALRK